MNSTARSAGAYKTFEIAQAFVDMGSRNMARSRCTIKFAACRAASIVVQPIGEAEHACVNFYADITDLVVALTDHRSGVHPSGCAAPSPSALCLFFMLLLLFPVSWM